MDITFRSEKLAKIFNSEKSLVREYGTENAKKIKLRMAVFVAASCLEEVPTILPNVDMNSVARKKGNLQLTSNILTGLFLSQIIILYHIRQMVGWT